MCIPHALPMLVFLMIPLAAWRVCSSETTRRTLSTCYTGISFFMCQHPKGGMEWVQNLLGDQVRVGLTLLMHRGAPNVFAVLEMGVGPNEIVVRYNPWSMTLALHDK
jgi:hypothetical protein